MPRWFLVVFAIILAIAIAHQVVTDSNESEPNFYESLHADDLVDKEAAAAVLAKSRAQEAFNTAMQACGNTCQGSAKSAAMEAATRVLMEGGCVAWEMSEWDPTRGMARKVAGKSRADAEAECRGQAFSIADRIAQAEANRQRQAPSDN